MLHTCFINTYFQPAVQDIMVTKLGFLERSTATAKVHRHYICVVFSIFYESKEEGKYLIKRIAVF